MKRPVGLLAPFETSFFFADEAFQISSKLTAMQKLPHSTCTRTGQKMRSSAGKFIPLFLLPHQLLPSFPRVLFLFFLC